MKIKNNNGFRLLTFEDTHSERGEYFPKTQVPLYQAEINKKIFNWFDPANNYPETIITELNKGFLGSIVDKEVDYTIGTANKAENPIITNLIDNKNKINHRDQNFRQIYYDIVKSATTFNTVFIKAVTDESRSFLWLIPIKPYKCRLKKKDEKNASKGYDKVIIKADWTASNDKNSDEIPIYPNYRYLQSDKVRLIETMFYFKKDIYGYDWYSINTDIQKSLILNEKLYRRNNWQNNQIKRGFKIDFILTSDYPMLKGEKEKIEKEIQQTQAGDDKAGGVAAISGEGAKLTPAQQPYEFDWTKDDTVEQMFMNMQMPRSLFGIKSGAAFSVEQVESDWEQYMIKITKSQEFINNNINNMLSVLLNTESDIITVNMPPNIIMQSYLAQMPEDKINIFYDNLFKKFGIYE